MAPLTKAWQETKDPEVRAHLGIALARAGREKEGRAHVREALRERPALDRIEEVREWSGKEGKPSG